MNKLIAKYPKLLGSSVDSSKLSMTIGGIVLGLIALITPTLISMGYDISGFDFQGLVADIINASQLIAEAIAAIMVVVGGIRKLVVLFKK